MSEAQPHVLVIDDDKRLRDLIARYLGEQGYRVTAAVDSADGRAKLAGITFDLLVVDVMMPGESGLELTKSLRETSLVPILLLTAMGESGDRIAGLETGADDYLVKPFEPRELVLRIKSILKRASARMSGRPASARSSSVPSCSSSSGGACSSPASRYTSPKRNRSCCSSWRVAPASRSRATSWRRKARTPARAA